MNAVNGTQITQMWIFRWLKLLATGICAHTTRNRKGHVKATGLKFSECTLMVQQFDVFLIFSGSPLIYNNQTVAIVSSISADGCAKG